MQYIVSFFDINENAYACIIGAQALLLLLVTNPGPVAEVGSSHCQSVDHRHTPLPCSVYWLPLATPKPRPFLRPLHPWNGAASFARPTAGTGEAEGKGVREGKRNERTT